jgi:TolB-like protein
VSDVFLSYARNDRELAEQLSRALEGAGFSVWWDRYIWAGTVFGDEIDRELSAARAVIVLWSAQSLDSKWVRDEASVALNEKKLIPVLIQPVSPPLGFRQVQTLDLIGWSPGYKASVLGELIAAVRHRVRAVPQEAVEHDRTHGSGHPGVPGRNLTSKIWLIAIAVVLGVAAIQLGALFLRPPSDSPKVIAVFPFSNLTGDSRFDETTAAIGDELRRRLGPVPGLQVIARDSSLSPTLVPLPFQEAAQRLGIAYAVHGQLQRDSDAISVQVRIENSAGAEQWSGRFERDGDHLLDLQSDVNIAVANALVRHLTREQQLLLQERPTANEKAWELYQQAERWNEQFTLGRIEAAISQYDQAIALDPGFARAYAGLAYAYLGKQQMAYLRPRDAFPVAQRYLDQALELDPNLSEAWSLVANIRDQFHWDPQRARALHLRAVELDPNSVIARINLTQHYAQIGSWEEALKAAEQLKKLDPVGHFSNMLISGPYLKAYVLERDPRFIELGLRAIADAKKLDSKLWILNLLECHFLSMRSDFDGAVAAGRRAMNDLDDSLESLPCLAAALHAAGHPGEARELLDTLERQAAERYFHPAEIAYVHAALGNSDAALDLLERAMDERDAWLVELAPFPVFDRLRGLPRFKAVYSVLGVPEPAVVAGDIYVGPRT